MFTTIQREKHVPNFADTAALARLRKETPKGTLKCKRTINLEGCRRKEAKKVVRSARADKLERKQK